MTKRKDEASNREEPVFCRKKNARKIYFPSKTKTTNRKKGKMKCRLATLKDRWKICSIPSSCYGWGGGGERINF